VLIYLSFSEPTWLVVSPRTSPCYPIGLQNGLQSSLPVHSPLIALKGPRRRPMHRRIAPARSPAIRFPPSPDAAICLAHRTTQSPSQRLDWPGLRTQGCRTGMSRRSQSGRVGLPKGESPTRNPPLHRRRKRPRPSSETGGSRSCDRASCAGHGPALRSSHQSPGYNRRHPCRCRDADTQKRAGSRGSGHIVSPLRSDTTWRK